jgi:hypothetical protein
MLSLGKDRGGTRQVSVQKQAQQTDSGRIVLFPGGASFGRKRPKETLKPATGEVEDLRKYEADAEPDDYRWRMTINVIAFTFIVFLTIAGIWLVDQLALLRKQQDCLSMGRKNCAELTLRN